ncbi:MAG: hypothetical protein R3C05_01275 [Pirellulaceae bacterium]
MNMAEKIHRKIPPHNKPDVEIFVLDDRTRPKIQTHRPTGICAFLSDESLLSLKPPGKHPQYGTNRSSEVEPCMDKRDSAAFGHQADSPRGPKSTDTSNSRLIKPLAESSRRELAVSLEAHHKGTSPKALPRRKERRKSGSTHLPNSDFIVFVARHLAAGVELMFKYTPIQPH